MSGIQIYFAMWQDYLNGGMVKYNFGDLNLVLGPRISFLAQQTCYLKVLKVVD